jgi:endonuclease YncB( thermonuclease family)
MAIRARSGSPRKIGWSVLLLLVAVGIRYYNEQQNPKPAPRQTPVREQIQGRSDTAKGWTIHQGCRLAPHQHNDGDSFWVTLPDGKKREYRLYFVDTPESQFKRYRDGKTNAERIAEQARYFQGVSSEKAVETGAEAKRFTLSLLRDTPFTVITRNEAVFDSERHYAHIELNYEAKRQRLDEMLVQRGLARIHTKGENLPDGTSATTHKEKLRSLEAQAKRQKLGAWQ